MSTQDLLPDEPDTTLDPYETLGISDDADEAAIRSAYKKLALKHHPDKVAPNERETAHTAFQQIAFAYAILSDPKRRKRYDTTGSTTESALDDEDFDWADFFKARYTEITSERIKEFELEYKDSEEERRDILEAYKKAGGRMEGIYARVMLSSVLDDEERFQNIIKTAIENEEIPPYDAFLKESSRSRQQRIKKAQKEAAEAEEHVESLGLANGGSKKKRRKFDGDVEVEGDASSDEDEDGDDGGEEEEEDEDGREDDGEDEDEDKVDAPRLSRRAKSKIKAKAKAKSPAPKPKKAAAKRSGGGGLGDLAAMISQRQQSRATTFLDDLEARYAPKSKGKKRAPMEEPPEEAFARTAARKGSKRAKS